MKHIKTLNFAFFFTVELGDDTTSNKKMKFKEDDPFLLLKTSRDFTTLYRYMISDPKDLPLTNQVSLKAKVDCIGNQFIVQFLLTNNDDRPRTICFNVKAYMRSASKRTFSTLFKIKKQEKTIEPNGTLEVESPEFHTNTTLAQMEEKNNSVAFRIIEFPTEAQSRLKDADIVPYLSSLSKGEASKVVKFLINGIDTVTADKDTVAARSDVFKEMLAAESSGSGINTIEINDVPSNTFKAFLQYLHNDRIDSIDAVAQDFLILAHKYNVPDLRDKCERHIAGKVDKSNAIAHLVQAQLHNFKLLKSSAMSVIRPHIAELSKTQEFQRLDAHPALYREIISLILENYRYVDSSYGEDDNQAVEL